MYFLDRFRHSDLGPMLANSLISAEPDGTLFSRRRGIGYCSNHLNLAVFPQWPVLIEGTIALFAAELY